MKDDESDARPTNMRYRQMKGALSHNRLHISIHLCDYEEMNHLKKFRQDSLRMAFPRQY